MAQRKRYEFRHPSQMELDLAQHLKTNIYKALADFVDTTERMDLKGDLMATLALATVIDVALSGLVALKMPPELINEIIDDRIKMIMERKRAKS